MLIDTTRDTEDLFRKSAEVYMKYGEVEIRRHAAFIKTYYVENVDVYKVM